MSTTRIITERSSWRKAKDKERQLVILTRNSLGRWNIVISILRFVAERLRNKETLPNIVFSKDLLKIHLPGNVYNVIDLLNKHAITKPLRPKRPHDAFRLIIPSGLTILSKEIEIWNEISQVRPLAELQTHALKVIRQLLQEIQALTQGSSSV